MAVGVRQRQKEGDNPKPTRYFSSKQEKAVAKVVGGRQTPNSGAVDFCKGDVSTEGVNSFLIECKTKTSPSSSISIKKEWLEKNESERIFMGKEHSALAFNFGPNERNYYIIEEYLFETLLNLLKETT